MKTSGMLPKMFGLALVAAGALIIFVYYYASAGGRLPAASKPFSYEILVDEPQRVVKHADVRSAGVTIGEVTQIENEITPGKALARLKLTIDNKKFKTYRDATFLVRQKTLVGENYVEVRPGTPKAGEVPKGAKLPLRQSEEVVPLDNVLRTLDPPTRKTVSANLQALGDGFDGRARSFSQTLGAVQPLFNDGSRVLGVLGEQRQQLGRAVQATGVVTQAIADRGRDAQTLVRAAKRTAEAVERRDEELAETFAELPSTLSKARSSVTKVAGFSGRATPVIADVRRGLVALRPVLRDLKPTATQTRTLFNELRPFLKVADPAIDELKPFSAKAVPATGSLDVWMRQTNPLFRYIKGYDRDLGAFMANFGNGAQDVDKFSTIGHCTCPIGDESFANYSASQRKAVEALLDSGVVSRVYKTSKNGIRKPNLLPRQDVDSGAYPKVPADPK